MTTSVVNNFNRHAKTYDRFATIQTKMAEQLMDLILPCNPQDILDIGCGTGILTQKLIDRFPESKLTALDIAEQMIQLAKRKMNYSQITFLHHDIEKLEWASITFKLIVSNAVFQWLNDPFSTLCKLKHSTQSGGQLLISTFGPQTFHELKWAFQQVEQKLGIDLQNHHLSLRSGDEWCRLCKLAGFKNVVFKEQIIRLHYPNSYNFLKSIKGLGASYTEAKTPPFLAAKLLNETIALYDQSFRSEQGIFATYNLLYISGE